MEKEFEDLYVDLPNEAIQRTSGKQTKKPYDTTGYGYQYCADRFNEVFGFDWGFHYDIVDHRTGNYLSGAPYHEITVNLDIWAKNKENTRSCVGTHTAIAFGDALKGAITNGFKKTGSFWGVGAKAYRGEIDPDNEPLPDFAENKLSKITDHAVNPRQNAQEGPGDARSTGARVCPACSEKAVIKGKKEYGGGFLCWPKKGGCGARWEDEELTKRLFTKEEKEKFRSNFPSLITNYFEMQGWDGTQRYNFCEENSWNVDKMMEYVESQMAFDKQLEFPEEG